MNGPDAVDDDEPLWRCLFSEWITAKGGPLRTASAAFIPDNERKISVFLGSSANLAVIIDCFGDDYSVATIKAGDVRGAGFTIERSPAIGLSEPHADIIAPERWSISRRGKEGRNLYEKASLYYVSIAAARRALAIG